MNIRVKNESHKDGTVGVGSLVGINTAKRLRVPPVLMAAFAMLLSLLVGPSVVAESAVENRDLRAIQSVIRHQITALKSGDFQSAYSFSAPNVRRAFPSVKHFTTMIQDGYKPLYQHSSYVFGKNTMSKGEVYQEVIIADESRQLWQFIYTLSQQQDKSWKVTNVVMYPFKGKAV